MIAKRWICRVVAVLGVVWTVLGRGLSVIVGVGESREGVLDNPYVLGGEFARESVRSARSSLRLH